MFFRPGKAELLAATCTLNKGGADQMVAVGYRRDSFMTALSHVCTIMTCGLLRLVFYWYPKLKLAATHRPCPHRIAERLLIREIYETYEIVHIEDIWEVNIGQWIKNGGSIKPHFPLNHKNGSLRMVEIKKIRYCWHEDGNGYWKKLSGLSLDGMKCSRIHSLPPPDENQRLLKQSLFGPNVISVSSDSYFYLFLYEVGNPFYFFQAFSIILWLIEVYLYYTIAIIILTLFGVYLAIRETRTNQDRLRETVGAGSRVWITGTEDREAGSEELVPGDLIRLMEGQFVPCDAILLTGSCTVNESMLTGESVPQCKTPLPKEENEEYELNTHNTLYCGTKIVQARGDPIALVTATGYSTAKGELVRSILYPPPMDYSFDNGCYNFILVVGSIASLISIGNFTYMMIQGFPMGKSLLHSLDLITIMIPASLPASMTAGKIFAAKRLRQNNIFCINSRVINVAGNIDAVCFDKTGTLTEDGLDVFTVVGSVNGTWTETIENSSNTNPRLIRALASAHTLSKLKGHLSGDPIDLKMFEWTGWKFFDAEENQEKIEMISPDGKSKLQLLKRFQFTSESQRQGVIMSEGGELAYYLKGAPETVAGLCHSSTVPSDLKEVLYGYTSQGYRVLGLAWSKLDEVTRDKEKLETSMTFLGLLVFENRIKPATRPAIENLRAGLIKVAIITGDHMATACHVGRECRVITARDLMQLDVTPEGLLSVNKMIAEELKPIYASADMEKGLLEPPYQLAVSGAAWTIVHSSWPSKQIQALIATTAVYARMSATQKQQVVSALQASGYIVAMCGDGANDCSALKAASVGISLSEAEASVASPLTSSVQDVSCVGHVLRECRAALATSAALFKFLILYCIIQYTTSSFLYLRNTQLADLQYTYIDLFIMLSMAFWFGMSDGREGPPSIRQPTNSVLSFTTLSSLVAVALIAIGGQGFAFFMVSLFPYNSLNPLDEINYGVWSLANHEYVIAAIVFSQGQLWRKSLLSNRWLFLTMLLVTLANVGLTLTPNCWITKQFDLVQPPWGSVLPVILLIGVAVTFVISLLADSLADAVSVRIEGKKQKVWSTPATPDWLYQIIAHR